jgi:endonuclease/exonuclease/phosphatase family metal-dependent hydrolase
MGERARFGPFTRPFPVPFRLLTYNILEGFRPLGADEAERRSIDRARLAAAQQLFAELDPDIVVLNEALYCDAYDGITIDYGALTGYPHVASALYDREWGNAILSRSPILGAEETRIYNRGGLRARIALPEGTVTIASYHPHPGREPRHKAADFAALIDGIEGPLVLCGDFNSISPEDTVDTERLLKGFRRFSPEPEAALARFLESGHAVFSLLSARGLRDAIPPEGRRYSMPTDLRSPDKDGAMRLDHIFVSREIVMRHGEVLHHALSEVASDHHPVIADLALGPPAPDAR